MNMERKITDNKLIIYVVKNEGEVRKLREKAINSFYSIVETIKKHDTVNVEELINNSPIPKENEVFISIQKLPKVMRLFSLLEEIERLKPRSIRDLAEKTGRDFRAVYTDVMSLHDLGLIELENEGRSRKPVVLYDKIEIKLYGGSMTLSLRKEAEETKQAVQTT
jgi:predicted transcriptional regulator